MKTLLLSLLLTFPMAAAAADAPAKAAAPDPNQACLDCHVASKPGEAGVRPAEFAKSVHASFGCTDCHAGYQAPGPHELAPLDRRRRRAGGALRGAQGQHRPARLPGLRRTATPRWSSRWPPPSTESGRRATPRWPAPPARAATASVHEIVKGVAAPAAAGATFATGARAISERCEKCHADPAYVEKAGLKGDVVVTFHDSIHGRLVNTGSARAPACADCHGAAEKDAKGVLHPNAHKILAKTDPASPVAGTNRAQTCGRCHDGANDNFAKLVAHNDPAHSESKIPHFLHVVFSWLAALTLIFFAGHVALDLFAEIRHKIRMRKAGHGHDPAKEARFVQRFDIHQRAQHWLMLIGRHPPRPHRLAAARRRLPGGHRDLAEDPGPLRRAARRGAPAPHRRGDDHHLRRLPPPLPRAARRQADAGLLDAARPARRRRDPRQHPLHAGLAAIAPPTASTATWRSSITGRCSGA